MTWRCRADRQVWSTLSTRPQRRKEGGLPSASAGGVRRPASSNLRPTRSELDHASLHQPWPLREVTWPCVGGTETPGPKPACNGVPNQRGRSLGTRDRGDAGTRRFLTQTEPWTEQAERGKPSLHPHVVTPRLRGSAESTRHNTPGFNARPSREGDRWRTGGMAMHARAVRRSLPDAATQPPTTTGRGLVRAAPSPSAHPAGHRMSRKLHVASPSVKQTQFLCAYILIGTGA